LENRFITGSVWQYPISKETLENTANQRPLGLILVSILVALEGLAMGAISARLGLALVVGETRSLVTSVALFALVAAATVWVFFIALGLWRGKRWARSGALFWQLVQLSVASASFSGQFGNAVIGWSLIVPSVLVLGLVFTKSVVSATMAQMDRED
jgi:hypothetical protein